MNLDNRIVMAVIGSGLLVFLGWTSFSYFSTEARVERRRRKNNARVVNRAGRPMVKLSAQTKKEDRPT